MLVLTPDAEDEIGARGILAVWFAMLFNGKDRHIRRLKKIEEIEQRNPKFAIMKKYKTVLISLLFALVTPPLWVFLVPHSDRYIYPLFFLLFDWSQPMEIIGGLIMWFLIDWLVIFIATRILTMIYWSFKHRNLHS